MQNDKNSQHLCWRIQLALHVSYCGLIVAQFNLFNLDSWSPWDGLLLNWRLNLLNLMKSWSSHHCRPSNTPRNSQRRQLTILTITPQKSQRRLWSRTRTSCGKQSPPLLPMRYVAYQLFVANPHILFNSSLRWGRGSETKSLEPWMCSAWPFLVQSTSTHLLIIELISKIVGKKIVGASVLCTSYFTKRIQDDSTFTGIQVVVRWVIGCFRVIQLTS